MSAAFYTYREEKCQENPSAPAAIRDVPTSPMTCIVKHTERCMRGKMHQPVVMTPNGAHPESDICADILFAWSASAMENLYQPLLWIISSPTVEMRTSSGMKAIGSHFAGAAMTERLEVECSLLLVVPTSPGKKANEASDNKTRRR